MLAIEKRVYPFPWTRGNFVDSIASGYSVWGCRVAGELVGYFVLMMAVDEAHLLNISVAEKRQRMGFGARLLRHAMRLARVRQGRRSLCSRCVRRTTRPWRSIGISVFSRSACAAATTRRSRGARTRW
jgi:ribosomal protein S18 acetylase RimI-like enzyme